MKVTLDISLFPTVKVLAVKNGYFKSYVYLKFVARKFATAVHYSDTTYMGLKICHAGYRAVWTVQYQGLPAIFLFWTVILVLKKVHSRYVPTDPPMTLTLLTRRVSWLNRGLNVHWCM